MITFVTVPLTSQEEAPCNNKLSLGKISSLPENLKEKESYAVLDQVSDFLSDIPIEIRKNIGNNLLK